MIRTMQIKVPKTAVLWSATLMLSAAFLVQPAHAEQRDAVDPQGGMSLSVMVDALPHDFAAKAQQVGLSVIEIEVLHALDSNIVHIHPVAEQSPEVSFKTLLASFPSAGFERLDDTFDLVDF